MVELVLSVAGGFAGAIAVGRSRSRRAFRSAAKVPIDAPIALALARYHRNLWFVIAGLSLATFCVAGRVHPSGVLLALAVTTMLGAGTVCVRADYMLCALDHPDVRLSVAGGFVHGAVGDTVIAWLYASPALIQKIAGRHLPAARLRAS